MNNWQTTILIFAILLLIGQILNIIVDIGFYGWAIVISWLTTGLNIGTSITLLVSAVRNSPYPFFRNSLIFLYISDFLSLFVFIIFIINHLINWAKIVNIIIITAFIVIVHLYMKQMPTMDYGMSPGQPQYTQMTYQVQPNNYQAQPNNYQVQTNNYQPPPPQYPPQTDAPPS